jgi:hypothetical protein
MKAEKTGKYECLAEGHDLQMPVHHNRIARKNQRLYADGRLHFRGFTEVRVLQ